MYHVSFRGNGGQDLFLNDADRCRFYLLLQDGTCRFGYRVHAFCPMTDHIHIVLQVGDIPLSRGMHNLSFRYTRWLNWPEITDKVCLAYNINSSALKSKLQQRIASEARAATGWLARESGCGEYKFSSAPLIRSHARRA